jgi:hypothetical protein
LRCAQVPTDCADQGRDHLLTGLLFDDAGHRMAPTHATKAGIRYAIMCLCRVCMARDQRGHIEEAQKAKLAARYFTPRICIDFLKQAPTISG